jgi:hypothetical protein
VNIIYWLLVIALLVFLAFADVIRPSGLGGRIRAQEDDDRNRVSVSFSSTLRRGSKELQEKTAR